MLQDLNAKFAVIIPARYQSTRFPGKPLAPINGTPMIKHVWQRCVEAVGNERVFIATDDDRISSYCESQGMNVIITSSECLTGTDRIYEAASKLDLEFCVNVQGDEPLVSPEDILTVVKVAAKAPNGVYNAMCPIEDETEFFSRSVPKMVVRPDSRLLYASRSGIPGNKSNSFTEAKKQVCIYAFPPSALKEFYFKRSKTPLENIEDIEILRFLEMGMDVEMVDVSNASIAVDFPEDIVKVESVLNSGSE